MGLKRAFCIIAVSGAVELSGSPSTVAAADDHTAAPCEIVSMSRPPWNKTGDPLRDSGKIFCADGSMILTDSGTRFSADGRLMGQNTGRLIQRQPAGISRR